MKWFSKDIVLLFAFAAGLTAQEIPTGDKLKLYLNGKKYVTDMEFYRHLDFADGKFKIAHIQGIDDQGDYTVNGEKITLLSEGNGSIGKRQSKSCKIIWHSAAVAYAEELDCGKGNRFFLESSLRAEGSAVDIQGEPAIIMGKKSATLTTKVVFRKKPSKKAKPLRCADGSSPLALGIPFTVYARTQEKAKVDKWENYWYYVHNDYSPESYSDPKTHTPIGCEAPAGWVFGEFVKVQ